MSALETDKHPDRHPASHPASHLASHPSGQHDLPYPPAARRVLLTTLIAQCGIVVTGALVRLTGSGLGCPTWPECTTGSLVPVAHQAQGWHKYIEFGNRLLTFVLTFACIASLVVALRTRPRRRSVVVFSALGLAGVAVQAILGGITVLAGLHPLTVAAHFLVSGVLIYFAYAAYARAQRPAEPLHKPAAPARGELAAARVLSRLLIGAALAILTLGTIVTGSGPHSGDAKTTVRFELEPRVISWLHADVAIFFLGVLLATVLLLRVGRGPERAQRRAGVLLALALGQGLIGYVQYFTGLPELLVGLHVLGAILVWVGALQLHEALILGDAAAEPVSRATSEPAPASLPQPAPATL
ncbi:MAG: COX15/CtaA family protein [Polyangia bacterium]